MLRAGVERGLVGARRISARVEPAWRAAGALLCHGHELCSGAVLETPGGGDSRRCAPPSPPVPPPPRSWPRPAGPAPRWHASQAAPLAAADDEGGTPDAARRGAAADADAHADDSEPGAAAAAAPGGPPAGGVLEWTELPGSGPGLRLPFLRDLLGAEGPPGAKRRRAPAWPRHPVGEHGERSSQHAGGGGGGGAPPPPLPYDDDGDGYNAEIEALRASLADAAAAGADPEADGAARDAAAVVAALRGGAPRDAWGRRKAGAAVAAARAAGVHVTPAGAAAALAFLQGEAGLGGRVALAALFAEPRLLALDPGAQGRPVLAALAARFELSPAQAAAVLAAHPAALLADAGGHLAPLGDHLRALGVAGAPAARLLRALPLAADPAAAARFRAAAAFWVGRGLGGAAAAALLAAEPGLAAADPAALAARLDWLAEHLEGGAAAGAAGAAADAAAAPGLVAAPLGERAGPRLAYARALGVAVRRPGAAPPPGGRRPGDRCIDAADVASPSTAAFLAALGRAAGGAAAAGVFDAADYAAFARRWREDELPAWLDARGAALGDLSRYRELGAGAGAGGDGAPAPAVGAPGAPGAPPPAWRGAPGGDARTRARDREWRANFAAWRAAQAAAEDSAGKRAAAARVRARRLDEAAALMTAFLRDALARAGPDGLAPEDVAAAVALSRRCPVSPDCSKPPAHHGRCDARLRVPGDGEGGAGAPAEDREPLPCSKSAACTHLDGHVGRCNRLRVPGGGATAPWRDPAAVATAAADLAALLTAAPGWVPADEVAAWAAARGAPPPLVAAAKRAALAAGGAEVAVLARGGAAQRSLRSPSVAVFAWRAPGRPPAPGQVPLDERAQASVRRAAALIAARLAAAPGGRVPSAEMDAWVREGGWLAGGAGGAGGGEPRGGDARGVGLNASRVARRLLLEEGRAELRRSGAGAERGWRLLGDDEAEGGACADRGKAGDGAAPAHEASQ